MGADPVKYGLVGNLARPDGNITGITLLAGDLFQKRISMLREMLPEVKRIAFLINDMNPAFSHDSVNARVVEAKSMGIDLIAVNASNQGQIEDAFAGLVQQETRAILVGPDTFLWAQRNRIVALATRYAVPASYFVRSFVDIGGLISYSSNWHDAYRQTGVYVGRILKGEKVRDLPVLQPTKFELVINLKTAGTLGVTIPPSLLAHADEVIE